MASALGLRGARGPMWKSPATATFMAVCGLSPAVVWTRQLPAITLALPAVRSHQTIARFNSNQIQERSKNPQSPKVVKQDTAHEGFLTEHVNMLYPLTFIAPPLSSWPRNPIKASKFLMGWVEGHGRAFLSNTIIRWSSKESLFKTAKYKEDLEGVKLIARALHRTMTEAVAEGDETAIQKTCTQTFARSLLAPIKARGKNMRYEWELVRYTGGSRIKSDSIQPFHHLHIDCLIRQTVVTIASRQRRVQWKRSSTGGPWKVVPGSEKEVEVVEHVAVACVYNSKTFQPTKWLLMGALKPTTLEGWLEEKEGIAGLQQEESKGHNILDE
ncbi:hypothetical protein B0H67DRAFT_638258 [Lasiosphaeris hirsuta]|uniref:Tim44-like domain-containing protein n=1 Tax=Lasiosphaeris hirsuta TaxID=260670 RepID=A0AA40EA35_9PEZI|nr:hypothetical protein B0H67DRAFT_638258 [Lasiosphaeris hirsuta]